MTVNSNDLMCNDIGLNFTMTDSDGLPIVMDELFANQIFNSCQTEYIASCQCGKEVNMKNYKSHLKAKWHKKFVKKHGKTI
jgi:hypothetical protein